MQELLPQNPEVSGLLALVIYLDARRNPQGEYVPLAQQDPKLWNSEKIAEAESLLRHASTLGRIGRYQIEADSNPRTSAAFFQAIRIGTKSSVFTTCSSR